MRPTRSFALASLLALAASASVPARLGASDRTGIYAVIDEVVLEPDRDAPERIRIRGAFAVARDQREYTDAQLGVLYFHLDEKKPEECRLEWKDLESLAGKGACVAFGARHRELPKEVVPLGEEPKKTSVYPLGIDSSGAGGLRKLEGFSVYTPIRQLHALPRPKTPAPGVQVAPGKVRLVATNVSAKDFPGARYVFELRGPGGARETSPPLEPGKAETAWTPELALRAGAAYTWSARIVEGKDGKDWNGPAALAAFKVKEALAGAE
jgi:hypothetical protein